mgnify:CR=1 FL=1
MIELTNVTKRFNIGRNNQFTAVDQISLKIAPARVTVLKGPSGSGKTTLLALIGCMSRPTSGRIILKGVATAFFGLADPAAGFEVSSLPERFTTEIRRTTFGFIFQQFHLIKGISALENIMLPAYPCGEPQAIIRTRAQELLKQFDLTRQAHAMVEWLSGGEQQRVAIARALINNPLAIIADEPTAHLDSRLSQEFMERVADLKERGKTVLIASHDPLVFEAPCIDTVVEMRDGRVIGQSESP